MAGVPGVAPRRPIGPASGALVTRVARGAVPGRCGSDVCGCDSDIDSLEGTMSN